MPPQDNDLQHQFIGEALRGILTDLRQMDNRVRTLENQDAIGTDPAMSQAGFAANNMMGLFAFPVVVTDVTSSECSFGAAVVKPEFTACSTPWIPDTEIGTISVHVTSVDYLPHVGAHCLAQHIGPYYDAGDWTAKYGLFTQPLGYSNGDMLIITGCSSSGSCSGSPNPQVSYRPRQVIFGCEWFSVDEWVDGVVTVSFDARTDIVTYVKDVRVDESTMKVQVKYISSTLLCASTPSDWIDIHTGTLCAST